jgi:hypothetical protein
MQRDKLQPSKFSAAGFLGSDQRPLDEIINADMREIENRGVTQAQVADSLQEVHDRARSAMGARIEIRPGLRAEFHESMGRIPSPFSGEGVFEKGQTTVYDREGSPRVILSALSIHLIRTHGFFQGKGSPYRIDPREAIDLLGIAAQNR